MENTKTIDMTPTWKGLLPVLMHLVENATTSESRAMATSELARMANLADLYVTSQKENN
jgi:hypothetical protein